MEIWLLKILCYHGNKSKPHPLSNKSLNSKKKNLRPMQCSEQMAWHECYQGQSDVVCCNIQPKENSGSNSELTPEATHSATISSNSGCSFKNLKSSSILTTTFQMKGSEWVNKSCSPSWEFVIQPVPAIFIEKLPVFDRKINS